MNVQNFQWDEEKRRSNIGKHGLDFRDAARVFEAPAIMRLDLRLAYGEDRWRVLGLFNGLPVVLILAESNSGENGDELLRVISMRKATRHEEREYVRQIGDGLGTSPEYG